ncbi:transcription factor SPT20 homolog [Drosophila rhopaloa]|uniref:Transcription factor SPT20 homolog n=1 Tax=Drosophila rhopaloa TaxID=1041015 RepID=A0A6P4F3M9_DRORH|nr:transcription factor SPT20 homolog [Drosophila rhopaloa]
MSLKDLNLTEEQILETQQLLKDGDKEEEQQPDCEESLKGEAIAKALGDIQVYVELGNEEGFLQIRPPQLHKFRVTSRGVDSGGSQSNMFDRADPKEIARWDLKKVHHLDLISSKDAEEFGKIQTDEVTGEVYMKVPLTLNILVDDTKMTPDLATKRITEEDAYKEETGPGHTIYMYHELKGHPRKLPQAALDQQKLLQQVSKDNQDGQDDQDKQDNQDSQDNQEIQDNQDSQDIQNYPDTQNNQDNQENQDNPDNQDNQDNQARQDNHDYQDNQDEPLEPPENKVDWVYHLHSFEIPRLSFPFELSFDPELVRLMGGETKPETGDELLESEEVSSESREVPSESEEVPSESGEMPTEISTEEEESENPDQDLSLDRQEIDDLQE